MTASETSALKTGDRLMRTGHPSNEPFGIVSQRGPVEIRVQWEDGQEGILDARKAYPDIRQVTP